MKNKKDQFIGVKQPLSKKLSQLVFILFFSLFTVFSVLVYTSATRYVLHREKINVGRSLEKTRVRLSQANSSLTSDDILEILYNQVFADDIYPHKRQNGIVRTGESIDSILYVNQEMTLYDVNRKPVFSTLRTGMPTIGKSMGKVIISKVADMEGFVGTKAIYSQKTGQLLGYVQIFYNLGRYYSMRQNIIVFLIMMEVLGTVLALVVINSATKRIVRPVKNLHDLMHQISENPSNLEIRSKVRSEDEIGELSRIFDGMLDQLEDYTRRQSQFISDVSHELRTPVAVVKGHIGLLQRWGKDDPEILEESLAAAYHEADRMSLMINDMLNMIRVQGSLELHQDEMTDLSSSISVVIENFRILREDFQFIFENNISDIVWGKIYKIHFEQALMILIDNAIKYSPSYKEVSVVLSVDNDFATVVVKDKGEGISDEDIEFIFDRFYRTDKSRNRESTQAGLGIGLSVFKQIMDAHHLKVDIKSELNQGTEFIVRIPIKKFEETKEI
ncbi:TPA: ATP-binding protein [Streptococcus agalactiae]